MLHSFEVRLLPAGRIELVHGHPGRYLPVHDCKAHHLPARPGSTVLHERGVAGVWRPRCALRLHPTPQSRLRLTARGRAELRARSKHHRRILSYFRVLVESMAAEEPEGETIVVVVHRREGGEIRSWLVFKPQLTLIRLMRGGATLDIRELDVELKIELKDFAAVELRFGRQLAGQPAGGEVSFAVVYKARGAVSRPVMFRRF